MHTGPELHADASGRLKVWAVGVALRLVAAHLLHSGAVACLELHPASGLLATAGDDGAVRLWQLSDLAQWQPTQRGCLAGHGSAISAVAFSACGAFLASCSPVDGTVRLWSVADQEQLAVLRLPASSVAFGPSDAAALPVAGPSLPPQLIDLRCVPACRQYCLQVAAGQQDGSSVPSAGRTNRAGGTGSGGFFAWSVPPVPTSPLLSPAAANEEECAVPEGAVLARWSMPPADGSGAWDAEQRCFVYRQGGHAHPVHWLLPLPGAPHLLTVAADGEGKLWAASSEHEVCGTLLPAAADRRENPLGGCRPALSCCGRYAVCGGPSGALAAWDLQALQRRAHLPLGGALRDGNAAAAAATAHLEAVTAVAVGAGGTLLASGDASGRLVVRWISHFASPFAALDDLDDLFGPPPSLRPYPSACARAACFGPPPAATGYSLHRQPSFAPPAEPEVHLLRTDSGVLAVCPLGRAFSSQDISLQVDGRDFAITAYHPGTAHWARRPAAYRTSLELAPHIDEQRIQASLEGGVLSVFFPYRPRPQPQRLVVTVRAPAPVPAPQPPRPRVVVMQGPACTTSACSATACSTAACAPACVSAAAAAPAAAAPGYAAAAACCTPARAAAPAPAHTTAACAAAAAATGSTAAAPTQPCSFRRAAHRRQARALPTHVKGLHRPAEQEPAEPAAPSVPHREQPLAERRQHTPAATASAQPAPAAQQTRPQPQPQQQRQQPRVIPVEGPGSPKASPVAASSPKAAAAPAAAGPASPKAAPVSPAASAPASPKADAASAPASPKAAAPAADKGKAPASPEQVVAAERRRRAEAAAARIAAGVASDSDWDDADGSVQDCGLDA
ncbi:hypothetical protein ABPG75_013196 [Micractinium tetrahymenae]